MQITTRNVGNLSPEWVVRSGIESTFTQVVVEVEGNVVAQFVGPLAKINASKFIHSLGPWT